MIKNEEFDSYLKNRTLMNLTLHELKAQCKRLKISERVPKTKLDACLHLYKRFSIDLRETDIAERYERHLIKSDRKFIVKNVQTWTEQVKLHLTDKINSNKKRIKWINSGFNLTDDAIMAILESNVWDANMHIVLLEQIDKEVKAVEPCTDIKINNENHACRLCYEEFNESTSRMQILNDCGHVYCAACVMRVDECPICRKAKTKVVNLFL